MTMTMPRVAPRTVAQEQVGFIQHHAVRGAEVPGGSSSNSEEKERERQNATNHEDDDNQRQTQVSGSWHGTRTSCCALYRAHPAVPVPQYTNQNTYPSVPIEILVHCTPGRFSSFQNPGSDCVDFRLCRVSAGGTLYQGIW